MKKILLLLLVAGASTVVTGQIKVSGDVFGGAGMNHTSHRMVKFGANLYTTFANNTFIGLGANLGINGKYTYERNVVNNGTYSVVFGKTNVVSDHFAVQPYIGVGFQTSVQTDYQYDEAFNAAAELAAGGVSQLTGGDVSLNVEKRYLGENRTTVGIPVGVNFIAGGKSVGVTFGYYLFVSNYVDTGVKLGFAFGKLH